MLILDRNLGQSLMIGDDVRVDVVAVHGQQVRLGITAPLHIEVFRQEIYRRILRERGMAHRLASDDSMGEAPASLDPSDSLGIPVYRRLRHPWTRRD